MPQLALRRQYASFLSKARLTPSDWARPGRHCTILNYHYFSPSASVPYLSVTPACLQAQLTVLRSRFEAVHLNEAARCLTNNASLPATAPVVAISIDDGCSSFEAALPVFEKLGLPVTLFVCPGLCLGTDSLDGLRAWCFRSYREGDAESDIIRNTGNPEQFFTVVTSENEKGLRDLLRRLRESSHQSDPVSQRVLLRVERLRELARHPLVTLAAHSMSHQDLAALPEEWLRWEAETSVRYIRDMGGDPELFAYPYGHPRAFGNLTAKHLSAAGVRYAFTTLATRLSGASRAMAIGRSTMFEATGFDYIRGTAGGAFELWDRLQFGKPNTWPMRQNQIDIDNASERALLPARRAESSVTMVAFEFPPCYGGISRLCGAMASGFERLGVPTRLITDARYGPLVTHMLNSITSVGPARVFRECSAVTRLWARSGLGLVVCGSWYPEGLIAWLAGTRPCVVLAHGAELMPPASRWRRGTWKFLQRKVCEAADLVIANSEYTRQLVLRSAPRARVTTVPLGVDHRHFTPAAGVKAREKFGVPGKLVVSSVSRLTAYKGHSTVFRALAALPETAQERIVYMVAGKGPHELALRTEATALGVASCVRWLGFLPEEELPDLYRASSLFVLCTRETAEQQAVEGFGLVFLEAQACGTPVVGTRTGGIPDAVREGAGGWLIEQDDSAALARILSELANDPAPFREAGNSARKRIELECTWDHHMRNFMAALAAERIQVG
jgi:phosphatidylinositol alpha-1,6-mannosyltransferase